MENCLFCGSPIPIPEGATEVKCPLCNCRSDFRDFLSEKQKLDAAEQRARELDRQLGDSEQRRRESEQKLLDTLDTLASIDLKQADAGQKLDALIAGLDDSRQELKTMLLALRGDHARTDGRLDTLQEMALTLLRGQDSAEDRLKRLTGLAEAVLTAQEGSAANLESIAEMLRRTNQEAAETYRLVNDFRIWSFQAREEDRNRLRSLQDSGTALLQGQQAITRSVEELREQVEKQSGVVFSLEQYLKDKDISKLQVTLEHAQTLQQEARFEEADAEYWELLKLGSPEKVEIRWQILLCRFGIVFHRGDEGQIVPSTYRPDADNFRTAPERERLEALLVQTPPETAAFCREQLAKLDAIMESYQLLRREMQCDVFISVKQRDGDRYTKDSDWGSELYDKFTEWGLKAFNSRRVHLLAGQNFEPRIIAALQCAKVMILVGSCREYMEAEWVRNEWTRFQYLIKEEKQRGQNNRVLISFLIEDMKPSQLPRGLSRDIQVIEPGVSVESRLKTDLARIFPENEILNPRPAPPPAPERTLDAELVPMLMRKDFDGLMALVEGQTDFHRFTHKTVLYYVCARHRLQSVRLLVSSGIDLSEEPYIDLMRDYLPPGEQAELDKVIASAPAPMVAPASHAPTPVSAPVPKKAPWGSTVAAGYDHSVGLRSDGTVYYAGGISVNSGKEKVLQWKNMVSLAAGDRFTVGLRADGTVAAAGCDDGGQCQVDSWREIVAVAAGRQHTVGLRADGTVVAVGFRGDRRYNPCNVGSWQSIVAVAAGSDFTLGLTAGGEVVSTGIFPIPRWTDVAAVAAGPYHAIALKRDGTVVTADNWGEHLLPWNGVTAVAGGNGFTAALMADGTVVTSDLGSLGQRTSGWRNIVALAAGRDHALGLRADGTVAAEGKNLNRCCDVTAWRDIPTPKPAPGATPAAFPRKEESPAAGLRNAKVGDYVTFGSYEQDNNLNNGKEPIEWLVLENTGNQLLVISRYGLDAQPYNKVHTSVTWETCSLRSWLNKDFYNSAFNETEQAMIAQTRVSPDKNPKYDTNPGNATNDKVFLLSIAEANNCFTSDEARRCAPTAYAKAQGALTFDRYKLASGEATCWWWLRSPGYSQDLAADVGLDGSVYHIGDCVTDGGDCVRPALYINLDS